MSSYTKAASFILDTLWEDDEFREFFYAQAVELADLGPLTQTVFEPAYAALKNELDPQALNLLESQVTQDLLAPLYRRPGFREMWAEWDEATRDTFIQEQSELELARLLLQVYDSDFAARYKEAYTAYLEQTAAENDGGE